MKNSKRVIAGAMALLSAVSVASCGSSSGGDSSSSYVDKVKGSKHRRYCYYP